MPPLRIPIDGLSRCLCPSIDAIALSRGAQLLPSTPGSAPRSSRLIHALQVHKKTPQGFPRPGDIETVSLGALGEYRWKARQREETVARQASGQDRERTADFTSAAEEPNEDLPAVNAEHTTFKPLWGRPSIAGIGIPQRRSAPPRSQPQEKKTYDPRNHAESEALEQFPQPGHEEGEPFKSPWTREKIIPERKPAPPKPQDTTTHSLLQPDPGDDAGSLVLGEIHTSDRDLRRYSQAVDDLSTADLHARLRGLMSEQDAYNKIVNMVTMLIYSRGQEPCSLYYDALIRANSDPELGSTPTLKVLLDDMKAMGVEGDSNIYHSALLVLAIHPNYLMRNEIMQEMKERWLGLSSEGWHWLVVGLIRDKQFEVALDKLEQMQSDMIKIRPWLYDILMFQLAEHGELDECWRLLKERWQNDREHIQPSVWYYLLEKFSSALHFEGTKFIWKARIQTSNIVPSDGMCTAVLNLAARHSDPGLATSVMRILSSRRQALAAYHYEALIAAYVGFQDFETAFRVLTIMAKAGVEPDSSTTRPLYLHLSQKPEYPRKAWKVVANMPDYGHVVTVAAINVIIESFIATNQWEEAMETYKKLHTLIPSGPNTDTFDILFQGCHQKSPKAKHDAMFLASEMGHLGIAPGHLTYDRLIVVCIKEENYEDAFRYLEEMIEVGKDRVSTESGEKGWWMRRGTSRALLMHCVHTGDERAEALFDEMCKRGLVVRGGRTEDWFLREWGRVKARKEGERMKRIERMEMEMVPAEDDEIHLGGNDDMTGKFDRYKGWDVV